MSDLAKRLLRKHNPTFVATINGKPFQVPVNPDGPEAAARIKELEAGLDPFAFAARFTGNDDASRHIGYSITSGDLRHAASLLEKKP